jgi:hypothetical protein
MTIAHCPFGNLLHQGITPYPREHRRIIVGKSHEDSPVLLSIPQNVEPRLDVERERSPQEVRLRQGNAE